MGWFRRRNLEVSLYTIDYGTSTINRNLYLKNISKGALHPKRSTDNGSIRIRIFVQDSIFCIYNTPNIERYPDHFGSGGQDIVPTGLDSKTGVQTNDVVVSPESGVSARPFIPKINGPDQKFPLVVHYHGGSSVLDHLS